MFDFYIAELQRKNVDVEVKIPETLDEKNTLDLYTFFYEKYKEYSFFFNLYLKKAFQKNVENGYLQVVKFLLLQGNAEELIDVNTILLAIANDYLEIVTFFHFKTPHLFHNMDRILEKCVLWNSLDCVSFLIDFATDSCIALHSAIMMGRLEIFAYLYKRHATSCKHKFLEMAGARGYLEGVQFLSTFENEDVNAAMTCAIKNNHISVVTYLLEQHISRIDKQNCLVVAVKSENLKVVKLLKEKDVPLSTLSLHLAFRLENVQIIDYILKHGNYKVEDIKSASAFSNHFEILRLVSKYNVQNAFMGLSFEKYKLFVEKNLEKRKIWAANKIGSWWIPICYDVSRDCGKRMAEKSWLRVQKMYECT